MLNIEKNLESLPFLSEKAYHILNLNNDKNYDSKKLLEIIEDDSFLSTRLLELSNSKYFGFINSIYTPSRALSLYGMNFTVSVCISELILNTIKFDLDAYSLSYQDFKKVIDLSFKLLLEFIDESEANMKEQLIIPLFTQFIGKFLISTYLKNENKFKNFSELQGTMNISKAERKVVGLSGSELSSIILKKWGFPQNIVDIVFYIDTPMYVSSNVREISILHVINTACNMNEPFSSSNIDLALKKANEFDLDVNRLKKVINNIKNN